MSTSVIIIDSDSEDEASSSLPKKVEIRTPSRCSSTSSTKSVSKLQTTTSTSSIKLKGSDNVKIVGIKNGIHSKIKKNSRQNEEESSILKKRKISSSETEVTATVKNDDKQRKRIQPVLISNELDRKSWYQLDSPVIALDDIDDPAIVPDFPSSPLLQNSSIDNNLKSPSVEYKTFGNSPSTSEQASLSPPIKTTTDTITGIDYPDNSKSSVELEQPSNEHDENSVSIPFRTLLQTCKEADPSEEMERINRKLLKYYFSVHPDFVVSKGFSKTVKAVIEEIKAQPHLVCLKIKTIFEELKIRRRANNGGVMSNEDVTSTGSQKRDSQVRRLNRSLHQLTKMIEALEKEECDLNEEISSYIKLEKYKKRACLIYEKICDLTGESKHAHRSVKKPIKFNGTDYPQFNKTIQEFVNRTKLFPDFHDVLQCLDHCNKQYGLGLRSDDVRRIAQDAFEKIGRLLQNRRKSDLYETAVHFTGTSTDPALEDPDLNAKLLENQKHHSKISLIIDKYAAQQDAKGSENGSELDEKGNSKLNNIDKRLSTEEQILQIKNANSTITSADSTPAAAATKTAENCNKEKPNGVNVTKINENNNGENKIQNGDGDDDNYETKSNHSNSSFKKFIESKTVRNVSSNNNSSNNISSKVLSETILIPSASKSSSSSAATTTIINKGKSLEEKCSSNKIPNSISIKNSTKICDDIVIINETAANTTRETPKDTFKSKAAVEEIVISDEDDDS